MNYTFDIKEWLPRFQLPPKPPYYSGSVITSPGDVCNNEQLRQGMKKEYEWGREVPVDVFVMAEGEPDNREATKLGGVPYREANTSWPVDKGGRPMLFVAQFNFNDSRDLRADLPGDLLLVFADGISPDGPSEGLNSIHFEWLSLGVTDLVLAKDVPPHFDNFSPCYGCRFRTVSYPDAKKMDEKKDYPKCRGKNVRSDYWIPQYQATQIGEAPFFIQYDDRDLPGRPLCTISSVQPDQHKPYPWINHPEPLMPEGEFDYSSNYFMIGDVGCIYISMEEDGTLHWSESSF